MSSPSRRSKPFVMCANGAATNEPKARTALSARGSRVNAAFGHPGGGVTPGDVAGFDDLRAAVGRPPAGGTPGRRRGVCAAGGFAVADRRDGVDGPRPPQAGVGSVYRLRG